MADAKPKKTLPTKKIVDIKSEGDAASGTSRPIIVSNRPVVKDPMMAEVSQLTGGLVSGIEASTPAADTVSEKPELTTGAPEIIKPKKKVTINVNAHTEPVADTVEPDKDTAVVAPSKKKLVIKPIKNEVESKEVAAASEEKKTEPEQAKEEEVDKPEPAETEPTEKLSDAVAATPVATSKSKDQHNTPDIESDAAKPEDTPVEEEIITDGDPVADNSAKDEGATSVLKDGEDPNVDTDGAPESEQLNLDAKGKPAKQAKKSGELTAEQQKAVENGEYFLPITTAETRRLRREIVFSTLFVTILIIVWLDIMLDAELLHVANLKAVTNFF